MRINANPSYGANFSAIDRKYLKWAQKDYMHCNNVDVDWMLKFGDDVFLFKDVSKKDAKDTLAISRNFVSKNSLKVFDDFFKNVYI